MTISGKTWDRYIAAMRALNDTAADLMRVRFEGLDLRLITRERRQYMIDYAYGIANAYGDASSELACEMYDAIAELSGVILPPAVPAEAATYSDVAKAVNGTIKSGNMEIVADAVGRLVKLQGQDTTLNNAIRDGAEWAWIPRGDTCAFCIALASRGWQEASERALKGGHAEHIHANCDCSYAVRFDSSTNVDGYNPEEYLKQYKDAPLDFWNTPDGKPPAGHESAERDNSTNKINAMRRWQYAQQKNK